MKKGKILVVDDSLGIRKALQMLLPPHFAEVEIIPSPNSIESAMRRLRPDEVLLDMNFYIYDNIHFQYLSCPSEI